MIKSKHTEYAFIILEKQESMAHEISAKLGKIWVFAEIILFSMVGTTRGAPIPTRDRGGALTGYKKDREGRVVTTRLDESIMELLALDTGGRYYRATATEVEVDSSRAGAQDQAPPDLIAVPAGEAVDLLGKNKMLSPDALRHNAPVFLNMFIIIANAACAINCNSSAAS